MMRAALLIASVVAAADHCTKKEFEKYKAAFNKEYKDAAEEKHRFKLFCAELEKIAELNRKNGGNGFGFTFYTDREGHELPARGRKKGLPPAHSDDAPVFQPSLASVPKDIDWRKTKAVTSVKNQGQCGSCWAFSVTEEVESMFALHVSADHDIDFSPQQVASCTKGECQGCGGGFTEDGYQYLKGSKGFAPEAFWPYAQGLTPANPCSDALCTQSCSHKNLNELSEYSFYIGPYAEVTGFEYAVPKCTDTCEHQDLEKLAAATAEGPVSVCVDASAWNSYTGGVMSYEACGPAGAMDLDHCVQLVGYNTTASSPYWIVRNSWSEGWGESGYIYLEYGKNTCGLANDATIAQVKNGASKESPWARLFEQASGEKPVRKPEALVV
jgi:C1A family cysteine protease